MVENILGTKWASAVVTISIGVVKLQKKESCKYKILSPDRESNDVCGLAKGRKDISEVL